MVARLTDGDYMARALFHAARGQGCTSPNPMVGAVIVSCEGVVVGTGFHEAAGRPHAEINALAAAGERARGATLYCTLEPCCHWGRTGPCAERLADAGIARVVAAVEDPNPQVSGGGFRYLRDHGVAVEVGLRRRDAVRLNGPFFSAMQRNRPFVTLKIALSRDGRIAARAGARTRLTGLAADRLVHLERAAVDAIAVGAATVITDDPLLTARGAYRARPFTRVIFDAHVCTPPSARVLSTLDAGPVIIVVTGRGVEASPDRARALEAAGAELLVVDRPEIGPSIARLLDRGVQSLLFEGGARLHRAVWQAGLADRIEAWVTPQALGPEGVPWLSPGELSLAALHDLRVEPCGDDVRIEGYVHRID